MRLSYPLDCTVSGYVLEGVCAALEWVAQRRQPAVLRMPLDAPPLRAPVVMDPLERAVALVSSLWGPRASYRAQRERVRTLSGRWMDGSRDRVCWPNLARWV